jgi:pantothenate kinase type III
LTSEQCTIERASSIVMKKTNEIILYSIFFQSVFFCVQMTSDWRCRKVRLYIKGAMASAWVLEG